MCWIPTVAMGSETSDVTTRTVADEPDSLSSEKTVAFNVSSVPFWSSFAFTTVTAAAGWVTFGLALKTGKEVPADEKYSMAIDSRKERQYRHLLASSRILLPVAAMGMVTTITLGVLTLGKSANTNVTARLMSTKRGTMVVLGTPF